MPDGAIDRDQIEVHWQHPRHELERPVLLVRPHPTREAWAAEITADQNAVVVCRKVLWETEDGEIESYGERVGPLEEIPGYVADALRAYESNYGPVEDVINPVDESDHEAPEDPTRTFDAYFSEADTDG